MADGRTKGGIALALGIIGVLLVTAIPWWRVVRADNARFAAYMEETVFAPTEPPAWERQDLDAVGCVDAVLDWSEGCPGVEQFCKGALPQVMRTCLATQDHAAWCEAQGDSWMSTGFGYHDCEARIAEQPTEAKGDWVEKRCAKAWRSIADHCRDLRAAR